MRTRTCSAPGSGTGTSAYSSSSAAPNAPTRIACMPAISVVDLLAGVVEQRLAGRVEHVDLAAGGVLRVPAVRHPGRDHRDVAGPHGPGLAVDGELELAVEDDRELLLLVDVHGRGRVLGEVHEVDHGLLGQHGPELQAGHELHGLDVVDPDEPARRGGRAAGLGAEVLGHRASCCGVSAVRLVRTCLAKFSGAEACRTSAVTVCRMPGRLSSRSK